MVNGSTAKDCGQRLRRIRMARNMSQQELADALFTTPQNISKYEKEGIGNIDTIMKINEILECNLLKDEIDVEGTIGEIGKEILCVLVKHNGFVEVKYLIDEYMHGLSEKQITKEIVKIENIGLCVREQYIGLANDEHDALFVTAKGIISLKNNLNPGMVATIFSQDEDKISEMKSLSTREIFCVRPEELITYEQIVLSEGYETYQEVINNDDLANKVYELPMKTPYKADFILYLKKRYGDVNWFGKDELSIIDFLLNSNEFLSAKNVYVDILNRMIRKLDNGLLERVMDSYTEPDFLYPDLRKVRDVLIMKYSPRCKDMRQMGTLKWNTECHFATLSEWYAERLKEQGIETDGSMFSDEEYSLLDHSKFTPEDKKIAEEYEQLNEREFEEFIATEGTFEGFLSELAEKKKSLLVTDWFSCEEVKEFVNANMVSPKNDEEKMIDDMLDEIIQKYPEVLEYFQFPDEWEESGIAQLIREYYGISD